jgi:predicted component of type VI protein secretion system
MSQRWTDLLWRILKMNRHILQYIMAETKAWIKTLMATLGIRILDIMRNAKLNQERRFILKAMYCLEKQKKKGWQYIDE